jgi:hypothetical protein
MAEKIKAELLQKIMVSLSALHTRIDALEKWAEREGHLVKFKQLQCPGCEREKMN